MRFVKVLQTGGQSLYCVTGAVGSHWKAKGSDTDVLIRSFCCGGKSVGKGSGDLV